MTLDLEDIERRRAALAARGIHTGRQMHAAEFLAVDVPALIAEVRRLRAIETARSIIHRHRDALGRLSRL